MLAWLLRLGPILEMKIIMNFTRLINKMAVKETKQR